MQRPEINYVRGVGSYPPSYTVPYYYSKLKSSNIIADTVCEKFKLKELFELICNNTNRRIVYSIKKRQEKEVVEIYLYYCDGVDRTSYTKYLDEILSFLALFGKEIDIDTRINLIKFIRQTTVTMVSYEFEDSKSFVLNHFDVYSGNETFRYNLDNNTTIKRASTVLALSVDIMKNLNERIDINTDVKSNIMRDLLRILPKNSPGCFIHDNLDINSITFYFVLADFKLFELFVLEGFNKVLPNENGVFNDLIFSVGLRFSLADGKINGYSLYDAF
jgi:hypothetical protein